MTPRASAAGLFRVPQRLRLALSRGAAGAHVIKRVVASEAAGASSTLSLRPRRRTSSSWRRRGVSNKLSQTSTDKQRNNLPTKMRLGSTMPNFHAPSTHGDIQFYEWLGDAWCVLFSHPADFTPVCTTELARIAECAYEFSRRGVKLLGHSCDSIDAHRAWIKDIRSMSRNVPVVFPYPIVSDESRELALRLDMIDEEQRFDPEAANTVRALYVIGPDRRIKLSMFYPNSTGRNVDEMLRVVDSLQLTHRLKNTVVTPANWRMGETVMVDPGVREEQLPGLFPKGVETVRMPSGLAYVRKARDYNHSKECWDGALM